LVKRFVPVSKKILLLSPLDFNLVRLKVFANTYSDCQVSTKKPLIFLEKERKKEERKKKGQTDRQKGDNSISTHHSKSLESK
jgi:hypothetical protein